jgi:Fe-S cluster assembly iron-binding protein IscA
LAIDKESLSLLKGCTVDYEISMAREGYVIQENPNADHTCSCKMSFSPLDNSFSDDSEFDKGFF